MNSDSPTKTLEEVCYFFNGLWKGEKPPFVTVGVIRNTNFTLEGTLDDSDIAYIEVEAKKLEKRRLAFGDIILEKSGGGPKQPVGRVALFDKKVGEFSFSNFTAALRVKNPSELDFRYLHKFLFAAYVSGLTESMQSHSTGIRNLDGDAYKAIRVPVLPVTEQRRIVGILDKAFEAISTAKANAEKNAQNARSVFEAALEAAFSSGIGIWKECTFEEIVESNVIGLVRNSQEQGPHLKYRYVKMNNITRDNRFDFSTFTYVDATTDEASKFALSNGDFLFNTRNSVELVGKACIYEHESGDLVLFNNNIMRVRFTDEADPRFVLFSFSSRSVAEQLNDFKSGTTNVAAIYYRDLSRLRIPLPPLDAQRTIAIRLIKLGHETQRLESIYQRKLAALDELKKSLLHQAFSGKL